MIRDQILKGASKYIEQFKDKLFVIKYGGSILDDEALSDSILDDIISLHKYRIKVVLVHGGGSEISRLMKARGKEPKFIKGLRVTDEETVKIVDEALSAVNRNLAHKLSLKGVKADSLISRERPTIIAKKNEKAPCGDFVGDVASVNIKYIKDALEKDSIAVVSPVGIGADKKLYNINADIAAAEISAAASAEKFIMLTDVKGVMRKKGDEESLLSTLKEEDALKLIDSGIIASGMIPKVQAGISALDKGVNKVHIISGRIKHSILTEVFTDRGIGTQIVRGRS